MDIPSRKAALDRLRASPPPAILVLTDEVARELEPDIVLVPLVVSLEMPSTDNYVPRLGLCAEEGHCYIFNSL